MSLCTVCNEQLASNGDYISCSNCKSTLHFQCASVTKATWKAKSAQLKSTWLCTDCRKPRKESDNQTTEDVSQMTSVLKEIKLELLNLNKKLNSLTESVNSSEKKIEDTLSIVTKLREENQALKTENTFLKSKISKLEQYTRSNNIIISNIPVTKDENVNDIVCNVAKIAGIQIEERDIDICHRLQKFPKQKFPNIVARFCRRTVKFNLLKNARGNEFTHENLGFSASGSNNRFYINEHLTSENGRLLAAAKSLRSEGFQFVWYRNGYVYVREKDGSPAIRVQSVDHVSEIAGNRRRKDTVI